jgi:hypothetical protein
MGDDGVVEVALLVIRNAASIFGVGPWLRT